MSIVNPNASIMDQQWAQYSFERKICSFDFFTDIIDENQAKVSSKKEKEEEEEEEDLEYEFDKKLEELEEEFEEEQIEKEEFERKKEELEEEKKEKIREREEKREETEEEKKEKEEEKKKQALEAQRIKKEKEMLKNRLKERRKDIKKLSDAYENAAEYISAMEDLFFEETIMSLHRAKNDMSSKEDIRNGITNVSNIHMKFYQQDSYGQEKEEEHRKKLPTSQNPDMDALIRKQKNPLRELPWKYQNKWIYLNLLIDDNPNIAYGGKGGGSFNANAYGKGGNYNAKSEIGSGDIVLVAENPTIGHMEIVYNNNNSSNENNNENNNFSLKSPVHGLFVVDKFDRKKNTMELRTMACHDYKPYLEYQKGVADGTIDKTTTNPPMPKLFKRCTELCMAIGPKKGSEGWCVGKLDSLSTSLREYFLNLFLLNKKCFSLLNFFFLKKYV